MDKYFFQLWDVFINSAVTAHYIRYSNQLRCLMYNSQNRNKTGCSVESLDSLNLRLTIGKASISNGFDVILQYLIGNQRGN